ncbi:MAG: NAD(P)/FAD-dependent oxidoreductase, partial [Bacteroidota bacterium]
MIQTDILIIGAGPVGLFTVFEAGLLKMRCHLVDALPQPGGQLSEIYPKKPIYDIPGFPSVLAGELVDNLMEQIEPFKPGFTLGERAEEIETLENGHFVLTTNRGTKIQAPVIAIAAGLGSFEPRKPPLENLERFEDKGVDYIIRDPEKYRNKRVVVAGGGDSALDWTIFLADVADEVMLIHRRKEFRGALDSVEKVHHLASEGRISLFTDSQAIGLRGNGKLTDVVIKHKTEGEFVKSTDHFIPLFGLSPKLGPLAGWGLNIKKNAIEVDTFDYSTNIPGIY